MKNILRASALFVCLLYSWDTFAQEKDCNYLVQKIDTSHTLTEYGYATMDGKLVIPFGKYYYAYTDTIKTIGFVGKKGSGIWAINIKGQELFKVFVYDNGPDYPKEGFIRIIGRGNKLGFANMEGKILVFPKYDAAYPFSGGLAAVCKGCIIHKDISGDYSEWINGKWGFIDNTGKIIIPFEYDKVEHAGKINNGKYLVIRDNITLLIDKDSLMHK